MHMADALLSTPVALAGAGIAATLLGVAGAKIKKNADDINPALMGVMGAFVFAAQMVNFSIPGTGSSGHIVGGILLASVLGPWAAFVTLSSVLIIQCLVFADGGLMALGCNIINMAAMSTLVAYPLVFRPLLRFPAKLWKLMAVSCLASVVGLEAGALCVVAETELSGVTALPTADFAMLMLPIHLAIGLGEGIATGMVLYFVQRTRPALLVREEGRRTAKSIKATVWGFGIAALVIATVIASFASSDPDGLEWSIMNITGSTDLESVGTVAEAARNVQNSTALMPDYDNSLSGIVGAVVVLALLWAFSALITRHRSKKAAAVVSNTDNKK